MSSFEEAGEFGERDRIAIILNDAVAWNAHAPLITALAERGRSIHLSLLAPAIPGADGAIAAFLDRFPRASLGHGVRRADAWGATAWRLRRVIGAEQHEAADLAAEPLEFLPAGRTAKTLFRKPSALHAALPPAAAITTYLDQLDLAALLLTDLVGLDHAQCDYLLAGRALGIEPLLVGQGDAAQNHWASRLAIRNNLAPSELFSLTLAPERLGPGAPRRRKSRLLLHAFRRMTEPQGERVEARASRYMLPTVENRRLQTLAKSNLDTHQRLLDASRAGRTFLFAPFEGDLADELLYWAPFVAWVRKMYGLDPSRMAVVAPAGRRLWYAAAGGQLHPLENLPSAYEAILAWRRQEANLSPSPLAHLEHRIGAIADAEGVEVIDASTMHSLFGGPAEEIKTFAPRFIPFRLKPEKVASGRARGKYIVAGFRPSAEGETRDITHLLQSLSGDRRVVLLNPEDWGHEALAAPLAPLRRDAIEALPNKLVGDLSEQTNFLAGASGFVGDIEAAAVLASLVGRTSVLIGDPAELSGLAARAGGMAASVGGSLSVCPLKAADFLLRRR